MVAQNLSKQRTGLGGVVPSDTTTITPAKVRLWMDAVSTLQSRIIGECDLTVQGVNALLSSMFGVGYYETTQAFIDSSALFINAQSKRHKLYGVSQRNSMGGSIGQKIHIWYDVLVPAKADFQVGHSGRTAVSKPLGDPDKEPLDPVTARLMKDALKTHGRDYCPKCGWKDLHMYKMALRCNRCLYHVGGC